MPELPREKERPYVTVSPHLAASAGSGIPYAELHCKTNFSFLEGASHPDELVNRATELDYAALAITDRNSVAGVVRAHAAAKRTGLTLLIGAEIAPQDGPSLVLLATDRSAYANLCRLLTLGCRRTKKGECLLSLDDVANHADGLLGLAVSSPLSEDTSPLSFCHDIFGDRGYLFGELHHGPDDAWRLERFQELSRATHLPLVASNDVHYHDPKRCYLQNVLTAIRHRCKVSELGPRIFPNAERHLKSSGQMRQLFAAAPEAIERTLEIAGRCHFSLDELRYDYPEELCPRGVTPREHLAKLSWEGARQRYPDGIPDKVRTLLEHELALIAELRYEAYFLTVWDLVRFARSRNILCQGRGSAANSVVCYCLEVTSVDPEQIDVLFERFISKERGEAPDIDIDFEHERREEVIQYVYEKYGRERAGMTAELITYRHRSAVRDIGKAMGMSLDQAGRMAGVMEHYAEDASTFDRRFHEAGVDPGSRIMRQFKFLLKDLLGFPRHLSQHVGGMVLSHRPLCELVPIENASMPGRTVIQWDKDDLDELGILKVDCLALGMLTAIRKAFQLIEHTYGRELTLANVPKEDAAVYRMIQRADTLGVFQIESRAQMAMLPRLKPKEFYDLVIEVAIVRPGPIQGDMVHPYLKRRCGEEKITYPSREVERVLSKTLGVPLFQEQAMKLAVVAAGFTPGESDQLRRAMAAWKRKGGLGPFKTKLIAGMLMKGYDADYAERLYRQLEGFGSYGFPESHAASFALLVYVSSWLKCYFPDAFLAAILNAQPMGFYAPAQLVSDARQHGVAVHPVDVNASSWECTLEKPAGSGQAAVRLGFCMVSGMPAKAVEQIMAARSSGPFRSLAEFRQRTHLGRPVLARLAQADAFGSLQLDRRQGYWQALEQAASGPLEFQADDAPTPPLGQMHAWDHVLADYRTTGLSLRNHPLTFLRHELDNLGVTPSSGLADWPEDRRVKVAGLVLLRQRPGTASGITFCTLEDECGHVNLLVHAGTWERFHKPARTSRLMLARGMVQRQHGVIHVIVDRIEDLSGWIESALPKSRDFR
ncbi:Error-prone DNA polymerase [Caulifigura coniformis]|uniref:Error-prone DNA polymerase n=1 Tax=Caulifigura coniformis TaxID=2527983 RepID=A0A517SCS6_9PLAN|nr:error-prone DNA polymerase [Caulifigura coniformis]QDT53927.1 Error-prone DNA polymerase [Caulifigura coniformis]